MPKLSHKEIIETLLNRQKEFAFTRLNYSFFYALLSNLSRNELKELINGLDSDNELYQFTKEVIKSMPELPLLHAEYKDLIKWFREDTKGKVAGARSILKRRYDYLSIKERKEIIDLFLLKDKPSDRKWVYKKLTEEWDEAYRGKIEELWYTYHEDECSMLIVRRFPLLYVYTHKDELENDKTEWWLNMRLSQNLSWPIDKNLTYLEFLQLVYYSKRPVTDIEVRKALYGVISYIVNHSWRLDYLSDEMEPIPFEISTFDFKVVQKAIRYIGKAGYTNVVLDYTKWDRSLFDEEYEHNRYENYRLWTRTVSYKDRVKGEKELREQLYSQFYATIVLHFPQEFKYMLSVSNEISEMATDEDHLKSAMDSTDIYLYDSCQQDKGNDCNHKETSWYSSEVVIDKPQQSPEKSKGIFDKIQHDNSAIADLVQGLGLEPVS